MGMSVNKPRGGRRHRPMGEINVTPFVDVMLVLLIVFMVTAPLLTVGVEVDLPKTKAGQINADAAPLVVLAGYRYHHPNVLHQARIMRDKLSKEITLAQEGVDAIRRG